MQHARRTSSMTPSPPAAPRSRRPTAAQHASSVSALVGVTSALRICPPSRPISIRTKSSATRNHLRENAVDGIGMDERDLEPEEPAARVRSIRCAPSASSRRASREGLRSRARRDASRAAPGEEPPYRCRLPSASRARWLYRRGPMPPRHPARRAARGTRGALKERLVRRDRLVEIGDGDPEVMDAPHAGDAIRAG